MSLLVKSIPLFALRTTFRRTLSVFLSRPATSKALTKYQAAFFSVSASASPETTATTTASNNLPLPVKEPLDWVSRTRYCGQLTSDDVGKRVRLCGWVALHRAHGGLTFFNLRDHTGLVQVTTLPDEYPDAHATVNDLRLEYVVAVEGIVRSRPSDSVNKKMKTGSIEFEIRCWLCVLGCCGTCSIIKCCEIKVALYSHYC